MASVLGGISSAGFPGWEEHKTRPHALGRVRRQLQRDAGKNPVSAISTTRQESIRFYTWTKDGDRALALRRQGRCH